MTTNPIKFLLTRSIVLLLAGLSAAAAASGAPTTQTSSGCYIMRSPLSGISGPAPTCPTAAASTGTEDTPGFLLLTIYASGGPYSEANFSTTCPAGYLNLGATGFYFGKPTAGATMVGTYSIGTDEWYTTNPDLNPYDGMNTTIHACIPSTASEAQTQYYGWCTGANTLSPLLSEGLTGIVDPLSAYVATVPNSSTIVSMSGQFYAYRVAVTSGSYLFFFNSDQLQASVPAALDYPNYSQLWDDHRISTFTDYDYVYAGPAQAELDDNTVYVTWDGLNSTQHQVTRNFKFNATDDAYLIQPSATSCGPGY